MVFISVPTVNEQLNAVPCADHFILAGVVRSPSVVVHHAAVAILGGQQDLKHGYSREVDMKRIAKSIAQTAFYTDSRVIEFPTRLKETKDCVFVVV